MARVFMTGIAGYLGQRIARRLAERDDIESVVGLDVRPLEDAPAKVTVHVRDVREPFSELLEGATTAIHLAWILDPSRNAARETAINIGGTLRFLEAAQAQAVPHLVGLSSTTAYGAFADNPVPIPETRPVRPDQGYQYAREKAQMEGLFRQHAELFPSSKVCLLRPCIIVGPGTDNFIVRSMNRSVSPVVAGRDPPWQFLHEDDLVLAVTEVVAQGLTGTYNVAPEGTMLLTELAGLFGARLMNVSEKTARRLTAAAWKARLTSITEAPSPIVDFIAHPWVADGSRLREALGIAYAHDSQGALRDFARARGVQLAS